MGCVYLSSAKTLQCKREFFYCFPHTHNQCLTQPALIFHLSAMLMFYVLGYIVRKIVYLEGLYPTDLT